MPLIIQHASGESLPLLECAEPFHKAYPEPYCATYGVLQTERDPHWDKVVVIRKALSIATVGDIVTWIDADCLRIDVTPFTLKDGMDIGMSRGYRKRQLNAGVIIMRNSERVRKWFDRIWFEAPKHLWRSRLHEQCVMNLLIRGVQCEELDSAWNFFPGSLNPPTQPVHVMAWHAASKTDALKGMAAAIERIKGGWTWGNADARAHVDGLQGSHNR